MNEVELLRAALAAERQHLGEVAALCRATPEPPESNLINNIELLNSCAIYLLSIIKKERMRASAHLECFGEPRAGERETHERWMKSLASAESAAASLAALLQAGDLETDRREAAARLAECAGRLVDLVASRTALEVLATPRYEVAHWRRTARVDADAILEERRLYAEVLRHVPRAAR